MARNGEEAVQAVQSQIAQSLVLRDTTRWPLKRAVTTAARAAYALALVSGAMDTLNAALRK